MRRKLAERPDLAVLDDMEAAPSLIDPALEALERASTTAPPTRTRSPVT